MALFIDARPSAVSVKTPVFVLRAGRDEENNQCKMCVTLCIMHDATQEPYIHLHSLLNCTNKQRAQTKDRALRAPNENCTVLIPHVVSRVLIETT